jgi:tetratricopeptide (TPR) repeat protein
LSDFAAHQARASSARSEPTRDRKGRLRVAFEFAVWVVLLSVMSVIFALAAIMPAFADVDVKVTARNETGFARLVFKFDAIPGYTNEVASNVLILNFDDQVNIDLGEIPERVPDYIGIARRDPDGRALRLALQRVFRVNVMEAGNRLFVDLLPPSWIGAPPSLPKDVMRELSLKALEAERKAREVAQQREDAKDPYKLNVKLAKHPTFTRVVFDWNKFVTANLGRQGRKVRLDFGRNAQADLSRLKVDPPKYLRGAEAEKTDKGMSVELTVDGDVDVRGFREGNAYVLDLTGPGDANDSAAESAARAVPRPSGDDPQSGDDGAESADKAEITLAGSRSDPPAQDPQAKADAAIKTALKALDGTSLAGNEFADTEVPLPPGPGGKAEAEAEKNAEPAPVEAAVEPEPAAAEQTAEAKSEDKPAPAAPAEVAPNAPNSGRPSAEAKPPDEPAAAEIASQPESAPAPESADADPAIGEKPDRSAFAALMETTDSQMRMTFPFPKPVASAAFRRGNTIWLVFDSGAKLDVAAIKSAKSEKIVEVDHVTAGPMQYVRLRLSRPWLTYVESEKKNWIVTIGDMVTGKTEPLNLQRTLRDDKRSLMRVDLKEAGRVHWIKDPLVGDKFAVVTALGPARGIVKPQDFVDFSALRSAHGIVVRPNSDDVGVRLSLDEVVITRNDGLTISAGGAHQYVPGKKPLDATTRHGYIDFRAWRVDDPEQLLSRSVQMQSSIALSPDEEKNGLRFALARLFIANELTAESLGILNQMAIDDEAVAMDPSFNAMRGAALVLLGRTKEARKELEVHALANDMDAGLWRALLESKEKHWEKALKGFYEAWSAAEAYPDPIQARFWLAAARAALELSQLEKVADALEALPKRKLPPLIEAKANLLKGRYLDKIGRSEEAMEAFEATIDGPHRASAAEAELSVISINLRSAGINSEEAIKQLERLQIVWRGDDVELNTMRLLADLYVKEDRFGNAFSLMESAVRSFPEEEISRQIQDDMRLVFQDLFLRGKSDELRPVDALSLFYDYRELTPVGRQGDEMIRKLADRLISVDLLDQASDILGHQVEKRLSGAARAQVATRLAMVHLLNRKPGLAIRALRQTRQSGLPETMLRQRSLLEARALGELGRAEAAIEILNTLRGDDVERLKGDALWTSQQWQKAGEQLERYLGMRWQQTQPLEERERKDVLRSAISYSLSGDQFALDRLRKKYYDKMMKTGDAESFLLVTKPTKMKGTDFRQLAKEIAGSDTLDAFMKEFRESYDENTGAAIPTDTPGQPTAG